MAHKLFVNNALPVMGVGDKMRDYSKVEPYFHNFEHSEEGDTHCRSDGEYPYEIKMFNGKHMITAQVARGHGYGNKPQWFVFPNKLGTGYDLSSGIKIDKPESARTILSTTKNQKKINIKTLYKIALSIKKGEKPKSYSKLATKLAEKTPENKLEEYAK